MYKKLKLIFEIVKSFILGEETGKIELGHGSTKVFIPTFFTPKKVLVHFSCAEVPNCSGIGSDSFDTSLCVNGFILICNINSNKRTVEWKTIIR